MLSEVETRQLIGLLGDSLICKKYAISIILLLKHEWYLFSLFRAMG